jgi:soluble cytochrome b562
MGEVNNVKIRYCLVKKANFLFTMVQYTLAQSPEIILTVPGKDSAKARNKAMDQLMELMEADQLPTELEEGFSPQQLIEVKEPTTDNTSGEDDITQAVQVLSNLATLKLKVQETKAEALEIRKAIDVLFSDDTVTEEEITRLKEGFKVLKNFAQANIRYQEAKNKAQEAREILDQALKSPEEK